MVVDDGSVSFVVVERLENAVKTKVQNNGILDENKGINFPERFIDDLPAISEKDKQDIKFAMQLNVDFVSVSCLRDEDDIQELRQV